MKKQDTDIGRGALGSRGFSLIELMIVCAILGALGVAVGMYMTADDAKLRSAVFNLGSRFKQAKYEAMKRGHDVYLQLDPDGLGNFTSYALWVDNISSGVLTWSKWDITMDTNGNGICDETEGDCAIGPPAGDAATATVTLPPGVEIYDATDGTISGGPKDPAGGSNNEDITNGRNVSQNRFRFTPSGDGKAASLYLYFARSVAGGKKVTAGPMAIVVSNTGRIRIDEWEHDKVWKKDNT